MPGTWFGSMSYPPVIAHVWGETAKAEPPRAQ
jgi:hypothetical protein